MAAFTGGREFISDHGKSRCAIVHCAFRPSFRIELFQLTPQSQQSTSGRRRRARRSRWTSHRQFVRYTAGQFFRSRRFAGLLHRRRHLGPRISRRTFLRRLGRLSRLDRGILKRIVWHFALFKFQCDAQTPLRPQGSIASSTIEIRAAALHSAAWHTASML